jgi:hypothetical protein
MRHAGRAKQKQMERGFLPLGGIVAGNLTVHKASSPVGQAFRLPPTSLLATAGARACPTCFSTPVKIRRLPTCGGFYYVVHLITSAEHNPAGEMPSRS